ncbi:TPA: ABC transporter permease subunit [Klebsiella pneumoniae]|nr:ABC transporter permease subunit [Klebsiella pneumoniae]HBT0494654.1 ABC transporter permease subunit [Klebsiella pneumoniae]
MSLPPLDSVPLILRPQAWLHRRHYGQVLSPIRWWGRIPWLFYLVSLFVGYIERRRSPLDPVLRSLVSARIAQLCHCEFCIDITSMTLAARSGSQDKLLAVADWRSSTLFSEKERLALVAWGGWRLQRQYQPDLRGVRHPHPHALPGRLLAALLPLSGLLGALLLAGLARSAPPQMDALGNSLGLALAACALGAAVCLLWLACGPARGDGWVWLPLVLPALPLADGQYRLALYAWLDGDWWTVLWGHLLWVVPWMLFILRPAWRQRDPRLTVVARTLGWGSTRIFWLLTLPSLTRPLLTALAVGFSVSIAQYLPTLWLGAGRIPTLTSQAVALSSGGEAQTLAAQALWQLLLPAVCFTLTALLAWLAGRYRRGLR